MAEPTQRNPAPQRPVTLIRLTDKYLFISNKALRWLLLGAAGALGGPELLEFIKAFEEIAR